MRTSIVFLFIGLSCFASPAAAQQSDDGGVLDADLGMSSEMEPPARDNPEAQGIPLACDGFLCDTTNDALVSSCDVAVGRASHPAAPANTLLMILIALGLLAARRLRRRRAAPTLAAVAFLAVALSARTAVAAPPGPVDVTIQEPPPPRRYVTIAWNPLSLILTRLSFDIIVTPTDHHALILSPHYFWAQTAPVFVYDDQRNPTELPRQQFEGGGGELGYRYYFGRGGARGWFVGPSLLLSGITATAANGTQTSYLNYGGAVDGGYQLLIANRVSINMGLGVQYTANSKDIPKQQFPAMLQTNGGVRPRFLLALGVAL